MYNNFDLVSHVEEIEKHSFEVSGWDFDFDEPIDEEKLFDDEPTYLYN